MQNVKSETTEDASSETLRKFLESDDPGLRMMGLSLAKGSGVPEELLQIFLGLSIWDEDKSIRESAKSIFAKYGPAEVMAEVEKSEIRYQELSKVGITRGHAINLVCALNNSLSDTFRRIMLRAADSDVAGMLGLRNELLDGNTRLQRDSKLLFTEVLNLEHEEFVNIVEASCKSLETMEHPCTAEELIELLSEASSQTRWIVACAVVEISCVNAETEVFWSKIPFYPRFLTKKDRNGIVESLMGLPPVLLLQIGRLLCHFPAFMVRKNKIYTEDSPYPSQFAKASPLIKKNCKMISTIFEDLTLAKYLLRSKF